MEILSGLRAKFSFLNDNLGQNIWRFFHFLAQYFLTTTETDLDYYHQKVSVRVASRVADHRKFQEDP